MPKRSPKAKPDFKKLTAHYLAGEEKPPAPDDPVALIERLCPVLRKHGVLSATVGDVSLQLGAWVAPGAYEPKESKPEPLKDEPRGDDGLTKAEADELYANA